MIEESQVQVKSETETATTSPSKTSNAGIFVSYRVPPSDYQSMELIAKHLHAMGKLESFCVSLSQELLINSGKSFHAH
jgi:hypothetical protein